MLASTLNPCKTLGNSADSCKYLELLFAGFTCLFVQYALFGIVQHWKLSCLFFRYQLSLRKVKGSKRF